MGRIYYDVFFGVEVFFIDVVIFDQWMDFQIEMFGKSIVMVIVCRNSYDGICIVIC